MSRNSVPKPGLILGPLSASWRRFSSVASALSSQQDEPRRAACTQANLCEPNPCRHFASRGRRRHAPGPSWCWTGSRSASSPERLHECKAMAVRPRPPSKSVAGGGLADFGEPSSALLGHKRRCEDGASLWHLCLLAAAGDQGGSGPENEVADIVRGC